MTVARPPTRPGPIPGTTSGCSGPENSPAERRRRTRIERFSQPLTTPLIRLHAWINMLFVDHGIVRLAYLNLHQIAEGVWRAGQPTPGQLRAFARRGGRSVVSLRAGRGFGSLPLELEACRDAGLTFHNLIIRSRTLPGRDELRTVAEHFQTMQRPVLLHCKSGADRSGFASALFLMLAEDRPVAEARRQLALRYGHNRHDKAGILDAFFDAYERDTATRPMPLLDWAETVYDPDRIAAGFKPTGLGTLIANWIRGWN
jgi:protein tyrosine phosphatase (PTP) superfamily phosphohydrolase (DUF442 family)